MKIVLGLGLRPTFTKRLRLALAVVAFSGCAGKNKLEIYPEPKPLENPERFLPGLVCSDELDFNAAFSPDGMTFFFSRSQRGKYVMLESTFDGSKWLPAKPFADVDTAWSNADPFITPDGALYYISNRPKDESDTLSDYDIWVVKMQSGKWQPPREPQ